MDLVPTQHRKGWSFAFTFAHVLRSPSSTFRNRYLHSKIEDFEDACEANECALLATIVNLGAFSIAHARTHANTMWRKLLYSGFETCFGPSTPKVLRPKHISNPDFAPF